MIGRAAIGDPFIFRQMTDYFRDGEYSVPTAAERAGALERFLRYAAKDPLPAVRLQAVQFVSGVKAAAALRLRVSRARSLEEIAKVAEEFGRA
jgi:tRNA-dihydrouridine synthase B